MPSDPMRPAAAPVSSIARYGDGLSALRVPADVRLEAEGLVFQFPGVAATLWPYADLRAAEPIRRRAVDAIVMSRQAARASLYIDDTQLLAQLLTRAPQLRLGSERWRTARPGLAVGALALLAYATISIFDLSPSKGLASTMPAKARASLGEQVVRTLPAKDRCTAADGRRALDTLVRRLMPSGPITSETVTVLDWHILNAFAVPGNRIVLTRRIIEEARSPDEIAAILGHEAGHAAELDPEASLVRSVGFWALVQMLFTGTPGAIGNIGTVLAQLGYTRSAERAADEHALRLLRTAGISAQGMVDFFRRMEAKSTQDKRTSPVGARDLLSSHPPTIERIRAIEAQATYPATPALSPEDWAALKKICTSDAEKAAQAAAAKAKADQDAAATAQAELRRRATEAAAAAEAKATADKEAVEKAAAEARRLAEIKKAADDKAQQLAAAADVRRQQSAASTTSGAEPPAQAEGSGQKPDLPQRVATAADPTPSGSQSLGDQRIDVASKRIADNPQDAGAYFERGQAHAAKRNTAQAIEDFSRVLDLQKGDVPALFWRASQYANAKQFEQAIVDYSEVIRLQPKNYAAFNNRGSIHRTQKKLDLAIKDFTAAIAIDNKQPIALTNRALAHRDRNELDAAVVDLTAVLSANPRNAGALVRRGETLELKAAKDAAIADYRAALKLPEPANGPSEPHRTARARLAALGATP